MTGLPKEDLIDLLEREVIVAERQPDKSWKILRSSVEDYLKVHPKTHTHKFTWGEGYDEWESWTVRRLEGMTAIGIEQENKRLIF